MRKDMSKETAAALFKMLCTKEVLTPQEKILIVEDYVKFENKLKNK